MQHDDHVQWERESKRRRVTYSIAGSSTDAAESTTASPAPRHQWFVCHRGEIGDACKLPLNAPTTAGPGKFFVETEGEDVALQYLPEGSDVAEDISARKSLFNVDRRTNARPAEDDGRSVANLVGDMRVAKGGLGSGIAVDSTSPGFIECVVPSRSQLVTATIAPKVDTQRMSRSQLERIVKEDAETGSGFLQRHHTWGHESGAVAEVPLRRLRARSRSRNNDEVKPTWTLPGRGHIKSPEGPAGGKAGKADG
jgi:hypothetical protein